MKPETTIICDCGPKDFYMVEKDNETFLRCISCHKRIGAKSKLINLLDDLEIDYTIDPSNPGLKPKTGDVIPYENLDNPSTHFTKLQEGTTHEHYHQSS